MQPDIVGGPFGRGARLRAASRDRGLEVLHWFLQEQREEVASMSDLLSIVERASESNILLVEDYLARNPVGGRGGERPAGGGRRALAGLLKEVSVSLNGWDSRREQTWPEAARPRRELLVCLAPDVRTSAPRPPFAHRARRGS